MARETLTVSELLSLFRHQEGDTRWLSMADSQEFLAVVLYLVQKYNKEADK